MDVQLPLLLYTGVSLYTRDCVPANRVYRNRAKRETYNNRHFDVKLASDFFDAKFIVCITFPDKHRECSTQALKFFADRILMLPIILK
jgi:hypothetical protein